MTGWLECEACGLTEGDFETLDDGAEVRVKVERRRECFNDLLCTCCYAEELERFEREKK